MKSVKVDLYARLHHQNRLTHSMFVFPHENAVSSAPPEYKHTSTQWLSWMH